LDATRDPVGLDFRKRGSFASRKAFFVVGLELRAHTSVLVEASMASVQSGTVGTPDREHWPAAIASLIVGAAFFALWFWLLPPWLGFRVDTTGATRWRWLAAVPSVVGFAVALRCVWDFGWTGHGTPAPVAPPKRLVVVGFHRYLRNPMYSGFFVGWIGLWVVFGRASLAAIVVACTAILGIAAFVLLYEEPTLRKMFGGDYEEYCRNVRRWIPRLRAWEPARRP
jgi:protein-S-isoprenylcysteine O-methyltransferase Ste14